MKQILYLIPCLVFIGASSSNAVRRRPTSNNNAPAALGLVGFFNAVIRDDIETARQLLALPDINVNRRTRRLRNAALHLVRSEAMANLFLNAGARVNARNRFGQTPLHMARNRAIAGTLIAHGADVDMRDCRGRAPLHYAQTGGIVTELLDGRADVGATDRHCRTPLFYAANAGVARVLLQAGADRRVLDAFDFTPLHFIVQRMREVAEDTRAHVNYQDIIDTLMHAPGPSGPREMQDVPDGEGPASVNGTQALHNVFEFLPLDPQLLHLLFSNPSAQ